MKPFLKNLPSLVLISLIPTLLLWLPFFLRLQTFWTIPLTQNGMATIVANYDGPLYIAVAKSLYNPEILKNFAFNLNPLYYAAHFPLYPILIRLFSFILGYPYSMLFVTVITSIFATIVFYYFVSDFTEEKYRFWLTFIFAVFPARWLVVRSIGSPEPLFIGLIILSVYFFRKEKIFLSAIAGGLAAFTKSPGILLFPALFLAYFYPYLKELINIKGKSINWLKKTYASLPLFIIPLFTLLVFLIYKLQLKDFFAYFHSGDNIHLFFPPFQIFNYSEAWVGTFWLEEVIFIYLIGALGIIKLAKKDNASFLFSLIFFISTLFIAHRDLMRYSLPLTPFLIAGFSNYLVKKEFMYAFILIIIPIFLFSLGFIANSTMPIGDWSPLL